MKMSEGGMVNKIAGKGRKGIKILNKGDFFQRGKGKLRQCRRKMRNRNTWKKTRTKKSKVKGKRKLAP